MRPLKVGELPAYLRLMRRFAGAAKVSDEEFLKVKVESLEEYIGIIATTVDGDISGFPEEALPQLEAPFEELNFPKVKQGKGATPEDIGDRELARTFEILISQGHAFSEIQGYTLPQFRMFCELAYERLSGKIKKKEDPLSVLKKFGIPVKEC